VTVFAEDFAAPRSWRATVGYQTQLRRTLTANVDLTRTWGVGLFGVEDLNLAAQPAFVLAEEGGRPVYVPADAIAASGQVSELHSRRHDEFAHVLRVHSGLRSETTQMSVGVRGMLPPRLTFQASYTYSRSRDQSSFSGGSALGGFARVPTGGDPNTRAWGTSDLERRHSLNTVLGYQFFRTLDVSFIGRISSGRRSRRWWGATSTATACATTPPSSSTPPPPTTPRWRRGCGVCWTRRTGGCAGAWSRSSGASRRATPAAVPWSYSLDMRSSIRPRGTSGMARRLSVSLDAYNVPAGLDRLLHGAEGQRGWGQSAFAARTTRCCTRGFDHAEQRFATR
jgi:hypothetical protein